LAGLFLPVGHDLNSPVTKRVLFICSVLLLLCVYAFCRWLTSTKFGPILGALTGWRTVAVRSTRRQVAAENGQGGRSTHPTHIVG